MSLHMAYDIKGLFLISIHTLESSNAMLERHAMPSMLAKLVMTHDDCGDCCDCGQAMAIMCTAIVLWSHTVGLWLVSAYALWAFASDCAVACIEWR